LAEKFVRHLSEQSQENLIDDKDVLCIMIAGLCHDLGNTFLGYKGVRIASISIIFFVGHGPYSHLWEHFIKAAKPDVKYEHEVTSIKMLDRLIEENNLKPHMVKEGINETDIIFIKELIVGPLNDEGTEPSHKSPNEVVWPYRGRGVEKAFLYEIVANKINGE
jgi:deoxynucleoside triphosphate triphosphohydrolase SAMHD1